MLFLRLFARQAKPLRYIAVMKSAYELAMERLNKIAPATKITAQQKAELADLDIRYTAKIAEREIALQNELTAAKGDLETTESLRNQLASERKKLLAELEDKKDRIRAGKS